MSIINPQKSERIGKLFSVQKKYHVFDVKKKITYKFFMSQGTNGHKMYACIHFYDYGDRKT